MVEPLVTIGIPVYNCERFIALAVKSVQNQSYQNFELIITDDGSKDKTVEILREFNDPRIRLIVDGENHGISYRLNQQIDLARGKYFCRMDGDDVMFPDRLERQVAYLESHTGVDVVGSSAVVIGDENEIIGSRYYSDKGDAIPCEGFIHPTVMGKTEYFLKYHYRDEVKGVEDVDLWTRSRGQSTFICLNLPTMFYRDPLKFKLKTYTFRQKQYRKGLQIWKKEGMITSGYYWKQLIDTYLRSYMAHIMTLLKQDDKLISKRNQIIAKSLETFYSKVLNSILVSHELL
jgi:Glycosyltransferases involved in cell wall biogenesis